MENIYIKNGYKDREEYLEELSEKFEIDLYTVINLAEELGESEDFDGLINALEDYEEIVEYLND